MENLASEQYNQMVAIDVNHLEYITSLIKVHKSRRILELGYGSGRATKAILEGVNYNGVSVHFDVVDNWIDNKGQAWAHPESLSTFIKFHNSAERDYVVQCKSRYDFILSDADHFSTNYWFDHVYNNLLIPGGILIYHDVTSGDFVNLLDIYNACINFKIPHMLFNKRTLKTERCDRGMLVISKTFGVAPSRIPDKCMI
jgi:predicted O-methyltransferase YrrM